MTKVDILFPCSQAMEMFKKQEEGEQQICSNRFISGRTLGSHMTAQNSASMVSNTLGETEFQKCKRPSDSDDESMKMKNVEEGLYGNGSNLMHALRRNPKCSLRFADRDYLFQSDHGFDSKPIDYSLNCDLSREEFSSLLCQTETHQDSGDAHLEESESQSQKHETQDQEEERSESEDEIQIDHPSGNSSKIDKWMKVKRSKKPRYETQLHPRQQFCSEIITEEEDIAMCLVMLASEVHNAQNPQFQVGADGPGSSDFKLPNTGSEHPKCIKKKPKAKKIEGDAGLYDNEKVKKASHKCITCNKVFNSYQALGGHRASHNKVKSCCVSQIKEQSESLEEEITTDEKLITGSDSQQPGNFHRPCPKKRTKDPSVKDRDETMASQPGKKSRVHICSICHRVFASGQALGGHKRCHWGSAGASDTINTISSNKETPMQKYLMPARLELLDLNLPAPVDDDSDPGNLNHVDGNAVDSLAQTHSSTQLSKDDAEADSNVGKEIGFCRDCDSDFPVRAQSWLQL